MTKYDRTELAGFLLKQTPKYDQQIIADIKPEGGWIGNVSCGHFTDPYTDVLNRVRSIVETSVNKHVVVELATPTFEMPERFEKVYPKLNW